MGTGVKRPVEILTRGEVEQLIAACSKRGPCGKRDVATIAMLWRTGLRIDELTHLTPRDVDIERHAVHVRKGKGKKRRTVALDNIAIGYLTDWLAIRSSLGAGLDDPLFCTLPGRNTGEFKALHTSHMRRTLPRLAKKAGINKRVHPHALRHTMASNLVRQGVDIVMAQKQLGHSSLSTTSKYLDHVDPYALCNALKDLQ